jgi:hypothetical protein
MALKNFSFFSFKNPRPDMLWKKTPKKHEKNIFSIF